MAKEQACDFVQATQVSRRDAGIDQHLRQLS